MRLRLLPAVVGLLPVAVGAGLIAALLLPGAAAAPDPAPASSSPVRPASARPSSAAAPVPAAPRCGESRSGSRVLALWVRGDKQRNRYPELLDTFRYQLGQVDAAFGRAAAPNGDVRRLRYVRGPDCLPVVDDVVVPQAAMRTVETITAAIKARGYDRADRSYVVWYDHEGCGLSFGVGGNEEPGWYNLYNFGPHYATVGTDCFSWGTVLHELLHSLGAVSEHAPHGTKGGHCWDDADVMCYDDGGLPKGGLRQVCPKPPGDDAVENQIDCGGDDYFNTRPRPGSWLSKHWNVADSAFLDRS